MIFGGCPYCDAAQCNPYAGHPALQKIVCEDCGKTYWLKHSNWDPEAFTEEQFVERYEVDEETKSVIDKRARREAEARAANPELWAEIDAKMAEAAEAVSRKMTDLLLFGSYTEEPQSFHDGGLARLIEKR